ncbi:MAG: UDP-N-acetylmuramoylalanine--D-glutamate ligase [Candidatus Colwellbacteria bacterium RIFCSPLOWO2_01_FULL_48_10]|uniref:UDP-N-acetylmuramoylalanine--D-glutamate ligase n=1 Tax=Candidatus Colwellbacteria bacterium RIFCSPLOWO2_01_FULL_48_10 TaxID=1797690 RepID=A0A1G1Z3S1_9BACT|nr:MAG: UDP-N-acetylmuramoylalanine--D-glutamate ligase [Candidatus Colwellbacteria bacterium RIFCSPLOWO2_01_FULL_48_10]
MKIEQLKNKKILILGYGIEGKATHQFLKKFAPDSLIGIADQKDGPDYLEKQKEYDLVIKSPGIPKQLVTAAHTTATNIFFANAQKPIIGITGTKGKSTTTTLIHAMLKEGGYDARLCGNIGKPMLDEISKPVGDKTVYVVELSSYQLDDITHSPHISLILNLFPEHMDYHGSFEAYKAAKKNIIKYSTGRDYFVYNPRYPELLELASTTAAKSVPFVEVLPFLKDIIPLKGEHNFDNVRAACTVAKLMNVSDESIVKAVKNFRSLPHRLEFVGNFHGIDFYDDAISTTPESTIQALEAIPNVETIFLGGKDRGYDFSSLAQKLVSSEIKNIVLFPDSGEKIDQELRKFKIENLKLKILETKEMREAVRFAYEHTSPGKAVLLSCASPSYSIWKNFEEKGDLFKKFVKELAR